MDPIGLIDVRSMFVSCERLIDRTLEGRPVLVLSNNDGCVVARSDECKALGVSMGKAWFELRQDMVHYPELRCIIARSSNYELYGDMSARFHATVATLAPAEVYSVDEAFVSLPRAGTAEAAAALRARVLRWTGLPTSCGVGVTKTLAKVAQRAAKTDVGSGGLLDISGWPRSRVGELLAATSVGEVWGVGPRLTRALAGIGVQTALDLARTDPALIRRRFSVVLERTARELAGTPCMPVGHEPRPKQQLMYSRMLGRPVETRAEMGAVLAQYAARMSMRLREQHLEAAHVTISMSTSRYRDEWSSHHLPVPLHPPTADPIRLIAAAKMILPQMREGASYNRAGILATGLSASGVQPALWLDADDARSAALSAALTAIGDRYGRGAIGAGHTGMRAAQPWDMRRDMLSPAATTRWRDLLSVR